MNAQNLKLTVIEGIPNAIVLEELIRLYTSIFKDAIVDFFIDRIETKEEVVIIVAYENEEPVGFKIGYKYNKTTFYSWVGGVLPSYRRRGIAQQLATKQLEIVKEKGYSKIRTKSMNRFKPMLILNLKNDFDIVQVYTNSTGQQKIVFEKEI
ncbi:GNAT family N-acetyltransferase [Tenacibaculum amylolyticum]|uniref:GNAT family N-acetyltransferase n=1 Tax=Tenacibaculum amylolyticum TaxID=104269 RepID=UPI003892E3AB